MDIGSASGYHLKELDIVQEDIKDKGQQRKTYHVRCVETYCSHNHHGICYAGVLTIGENGKCLCYE